MQTKEIQQTEWPAFFDNFSRRHKGSLVNLEIFGSEIGDQIEGRELSLEGITAERDKEEGTLLAIMVGAKPDDHITHRIARPIQVSLEQTDEGVAAALAIKATDGTTALLRFPSAVPSFLRLISDEDRTNEDLISS